MDRRIHVDAETVTDAPNLDVLVKGVVVAVFRQDADVAFAVGDLVLAGGVVSDIGVGDVLNMPDHAVEDFGDCNVGLVVGWNNLATWAVLALVIGHLPDVLRQFVDGQARAGVDRLPLHRAPSRQHISRPLPVIVRAASVELQVVNLILAGLRQRPNGHIQAAAGSRQDIGRGVLLTAAVGYRTSGGYAGVISHYFLPFGAARLTAYAIATACFTGLPAATSAFTFLRKASGVLDLTSAIISSSLSWQNL